MKRSTINTASLVNRRPSKDAHRIAHARFPQNRPGSEGWVWCRCSWDGPVPQFAEHRRTLGLSLDATHRALPSEADMPSVWR